MDTVSLTSDTIASRSRTEVIVQEDILDTTVRGKVFNNPIMIN